MIRRKTARLVHLAHILRGRRDLRYSLMMERLRHLLSVLDRTVFHVVHGLLRDVAGEAC